MVKWDLSDLHKNLKKKDVDGILKNIDKKVSLLEKQRKKLNNNTSAKTVLNVLEQFEKIIKEAEILDCYIHLKWDENTASPETTALRGFIQQKLSDTSNRLLFLSLWWKDLDDKRANKIIKEIPKYKYYLKESRRFKKHMLSEQEEKIISIKDVTGANALTQLANTIRGSFVFSFKGKEMPTEELTQYLFTHSAKNREKAYMLMAAKQKKHNPVLGEIYRNVVIDWKNEGVDLRKYNSPIAMRNLSNNISDKTVNVLLKVCDKNRKTFARYYALKSKLLGMKKLKAPDMFAPLTKNKFSLPYKEAEKLVLEMFHHFSPEFGKLAENVVKRKHIHSDIQKGKKGGAYSLSLMPEIVPFILLNYNGDYHSVSALAHELGHSIHSQLAKDKGFFEFDAPLPLAESASLFSEMLLSEHLITKGLSKNEEINIRAYILETLLGNISAAYDCMFEQAAHELLTHGGTIQEVNKKYLENKKKTYGKSVVFPDETQYSWTRISHFYETPFYYYAYAFGSLIVLASYKKYKENPKEFIPKFTKYLSEGGSKDPEEITKDLGVNVRSEAFWQSGFDMAEELIKELALLAK